MRGRETIQNTNGPDQAGDGERKTTGTRDDGKGQTWNLTNQTDQPDDPSNQKTHQQRSETAEGLHARFPCEGAADALCNPETCLSWRGTGDPTRSKGLGGDPGDNPPKGGGPPAPTRLQDEGQKVAPGAATWARLRVSTAAKTSATEGAAEEMWEVRNREETEKPNASAKPETPQTLATGGGRGVKALIEFGHSPLLSPDWGGREGRETDQHAGVWGGGGGGQESGFADDGG